MDRQDDSGSRIRVGDMVRTDRLGPPMRVIRIEGGKVRCAWRDETGHQLGEFDPAELVLADDETVSGPLRRTT